MAKHYSAVAKASALPRGGLVMLEDPCAPQAGAEAFHESPSSPPRKEQWKGNQLATNPHL